MSNSKFGAKQQLNIYFVLLLFAIFFFFPLKLVIGPYVANLSLSKDIYEILVIWINVCLIRPNVFYSLPFSSSWNNYLQRFPEKLHFYVFLNKRQKIGTSPVGMSLDRKHMIPTQSKFFAIPSPTNHPYNFSWHIKYVIHT